MTAQTPAVLKSYFETGDIPTQSEFGDLVDTISAAQTDATTAINDSATAVSDSSTALSTANAAQSDATQALADAATAQAAADGSFRWKSSNAYILGDKVRHPTANTMMICTTANSDVNFTVGNWRVLNYDFVGTNDPLIDTPDLQALINSIPIGVLARLQIIGDVSINAAIWIQDGRRVTIWADAHPTVTCNQETAFKFVSARDEITSSTAAPDFQVVSAGLLKGARTMPSLVGRTLEPGDWIVVAGAKDPKSGYTDQAVAPPFNKAQGGSATTIIIGATETQWVDLQLIDSYVRITSGTNAGQTRLITAYVASTKTATVTPEWDSGIAPDGTSEYELWEPQCNYGEPMLVEKDTGGTITFAGVFRDDIPPIALPTGGTGYNVWAKDLVRDVGISGINFFHSNNAGKSVVFVDCDRWHMRDCHTIDANIARIYASYRGVVEHNSCVLTDGGGPHSGIRIQQNCGDVLIQYNNVKSGGNAIDISGGGTKTAASGYCKNVVFYRNTCHESNQAPIRAHAHSGCDFIENTVMCNNDYDGQETAALIDGQWTRLYRNYITLDGQGIARSAIRITSKGVTVSGNVINTTNNYKSTPTTGRGAGITLGYSTFEVDATHNNILDGTVIVTGNEITSSDGVGNGISVAGSAGEYCRGVRVVNNLIMDCHIGLRAYNSDLSAQTNKLWNNVLINCTYPERVDGTFEWVSEPQFRNNMVG